MASQEILRAFLEIDGRGRERKGFAGLPGRGAVDERNELPAEKKILLADAMA